MNKEAEQLIIEIRKEIELIDKAIEQADKAYTMTVDEKVIKNIVEDARNYNPPFKFGL